MMLLEAFDKVAKLLAWVIQEEPEIEKMAQQGDPEKFKFPQPMLLVTDS